MRLVCVVYHVFCGGRVVLWLRALCIVERCVCLVVGCVHCVICGVICVSCVVCHVLCGVCVAGVRRCVLCGL